MIKQSETMEADDIIETGYYQGGGYLYEHGVKPACTFCGSTVSQYNQNTWDGDVCPECLKEE